MALISDAQVHKDSINVLNQIANFVNWTTALTGIINTFGDYKGTYTDPADQAWLDTKLTQAQGLVTTLNDLITAKLAL